MTQTELLDRMRGVRDRNIPNPGSGSTPLRHRMLFEIGREDLSLARLAEAHWDAVAILAEANRSPAPGAIYGVWASEKPQQMLRLESVPGGLLLHGIKMFCSGAGLVDHALVTVGSPEQLLLDLNMKQQEGHVSIDHSAWKTSAFAATDTSTVTFHGAAASHDAIICDPGWYLKRPGFWHGACGPASCWAGGAAALVDYAMQQQRADAHTRAHLGAMTAAVWALHAYLDVAGREIDERPADQEGALIRALTVRHLVEQASSEVLRRLTRAYGPHPLAMDEEIGRRYVELDLYLRQSHAERDLEALGNAIKRRA